MVRQGGWTVKSLLLFLLVLLSGCDNASAPVTRTVKVWLGDSVEPMQAALGKDLTRDCDETMCWYNFTKPSKSGNVLNLVLGGDRPFGIDRVFSFSAPVYKENHDRFDEINIYPLGLPEDSLLADSRVWFYQLVGRLQAAGWQRFITQNEPRLPGSEAANATRIEQVMTASSLSTPLNDPSSPLNNAQWLALPFLSDWYFYRGNEYLTLSAQRENSKTAPAERGTYLFTLAFRSEEQTYQDYFKYEDHHRWKTLLPALLKKMATQRAQQEARLRAAGIRIDENYRDPVIRALNMQ